MKASRLIASGVLVCALALLASCSSGPVRRVSEPAASIDQLTVRADGSWSVQLRINNFSSIPMQFGAVNLRMTVANQDAGTLSGQAGITIAGESADVVTLTHAPRAGVRLALADALAARRNVSYSIDGTINATPTDKPKPKDYDVKRTSSLSPVPGLEGVLR